MGFIAFTLWMTLTSVPHVHGDVITQKRIKEMEVSSGERAPYLVKKLAELSDHQLLDLATQYPIMEGESEDLYELEDYVKKIIRRLAPPGNSSLDRFLILLLDDPSPNAFVIQNDKRRPVLGINRGIFKLAKTEDELSFVIAHEMGHILREEHLKSNQVKIKPLDKWIQQMEEENKVDGVAIMLLQLAGYSPNAGPEIFSKLLEWSEDHKLFFDQQRVACLLSHPPSESRITNLSFAVDNIMNRQQVALPTNIDPRVRKINHGFSWENSYFSNFSLTMISGDQRENLFFGFDAASGYFYQPWMVNSGDRNNWDYFGRISRSPKIKDSKVGQSLQEEAHDFNVQEGYHTNIYENLLRHRLQAYLKFLRDLINPWSIGRVGGFYHEHKDGGAAPPGEEGVLIGFHRAWQGLPVDWRKNKTIQKLWREEGLLLQKLHLWGGEAKVH